MILNSSVKKNVSKELAKKNSFWIMEGSKQGKSSFLGLLPSLGKQENLIFVPLPFTSIHSEIELAEQITTSFAKSSNNSFYELDFEDNLYDVLIKVNKTATESKKHVYLVIDDFNLIYNFKDYYALLRRFRSYLNSFKNISCVFSFQSDSDLEDLFTTPYKPLNRLGKRIYISPLDKEIILEEIEKLILLKNINTKDKHILTLCETLNYSLYYIQTFLSKLKDEEKLNNKKIATLHSYFEEMYSVQFKNWLFELSEVQNKVLRAMLQAEDTLMAKGTMKKFKINGSASVIRALKGMEKKGIIVRLPQGKYEFQNPLFPIWAKKVF